MGCYVGSRGSEVTEFEAEYEINPNIETKLVHGPLKIDEGLASDKFNPENLASLATIKLGVQITRSKRGLSDSVSALSSSSGRNTTCTSDKYTWSVHQKWELANSPSEILPTLYIGSKEDAINVEKIKKLQITHILTVTSGSQHDVPGCKLLAVPMHDGGRSDLEDIMRKTAGFMEEAQRPGNRLLVHCKEGHNRSPTLVIAWLMKTGKQTLFKSYKFVYEKRNVIHPHIKYISQLREMEKSMLGWYSVPPDFLARSMVNSEHLTAHKDWTENKSQEYIQQQSNKLLQEKEVVENKTMEGYLSKSSGVGTVTSSVSSFRDVSTMSSTIFDDGSGVITSRIPKYK